MRTYLREMFPLPRRIATAALMAASFETLLARVHGVPARLAEPGMLRSLWAVFGLLLALRLMDELKDEALDRALFPHRPLPSGRVKREDISRSLAVIVLLYVPLHLGAGIGLVSAAAVLAYALLMSRFFFMPGRLRASLPLTLATHTPVIPLLHLHLVVLFAVRRDLPLRDLRFGPVLLLVAAYWAAAFAWEISRKIRAREEEDAYVTYSRLLGRRGAVGMAAGAQLLALGAALALALTQPVSFRFPMVLATGCGLAFIADARFLRSPSRRTSRLAPFAEAALLGLLAGGCLA
jgi:4-hydroxybenzoate polyprenyltransferase